MQQQTQTYPRAQLRESSSIIKILDPLVKEWFFEPRKIYKPHIFIIKRLNINSNYYMRRFKMNGY